MSKQGITLFAKQLENLQEARGKLFELGTRTSPTDNQDIRLAQLCDEMKDSIKKEFCEITLE